MFRKLNVRELFDWNSEGGGEFMRIFSFFIFSSISSLMIRPNEKKLCGSTSLQLTYNGHCLVSLSAEY